jgi:NADH-ubiquinone oxidoreductase chain 5
MYLLIVFLPLLGSLIAGFFGKKIGMYGSAHITIFCLVCTFILSCFAFYEVALCKSPCFIDLTTWIDCEMFHVSWGFMFDSLTVVMLVVVTCVSSIVHIYSVGYMGEDPHLSRFMSYLSLFTFFMLILVTADNLIQMFVGWEGVGLCSYLLINFWYSRIQANKAAIKAVIVNRVGDFGLALGIIGIFFVFKTVNYTTLFSLVPYYVSTLNPEYLSLNLLGIEFDTITILCLLLFVGSVGKSAQIGLHTWLPDAMEGPTPVSALIHAATMVTAGVFLIVRCSPLFEYSSTALSVITCMGAMTAFFAATTALTQNDLKRVIAYSTCSQLGYMVFACGISNYAVSAFHLANHAFFKALLFLTAGSVIHAMSDEQDMRKMGGLTELLPLTYAFMMIGSLSLMGFPFLTGFYSKDAILELAYAKYTVSGHFAHWLGTISAFFTAFYSMRLIFLTFGRSTKAYKSSINSVHEMPPVMAYPLSLLLFGSIFIGFLTKDMIIGVGTDFWNNAIFQLPENLIIFEAEFMPTWIKLIPVILSFTGAFLGFIVYWVYGTLENNFFKDIVFKDKKDFLPNRLFINFYTFLNRKWFVDKVNNEFISQNALFLGYEITYKTLDRGIIEIFGPFGISSLLYSKNSFVNKLQTGLIYHYTFAILFGTISLIILIGFSPYISYIIDPRILILFIFLILFNLVIISK